MPGAHKEFVDALCFFFSALRPIVWVVAIGCTLRVPEIALCLLRLPLFLVAQSVGVRRVLRLRRLVDSARRLLARTLLAALDSTAVVCCLICLISSHSKASSNESYSVCGTIVDPASPFGEMLRRAELRGAALYCLLCTVRLAGAHSLALKPIHLRYSPASWRVFDWMGVLFLWEALSARSALIIPVYCLYAYASSIQRCTYDLNLGPTYYATLGLSTLAYAYSLYLGVKAMRCSEEGPQRGAGAFSALYNGAQLFSNGLQAACFGSISSLRLVRSWYRVVTERAVRDANA